MTFVRAAAVAMIVSALLAPSSAGALGQTSVPEPSARTLSWPVAGAVLRGFQAPASPYGSGHRGIDIAAPVGTSIHAAAGGTVSFAGHVAGALYVTIDHGSGLATTYSWLSALRVHKADKVSRGAVIALSGAGHAITPTPNLHFAVKVDGSYVDPLGYLEPMDLTGLIFLAPISTPGGRLTP